MLGFMKRLDDLAGFFANHQVEFPDFVEGETLLLVVI